MSDAAFRLTLPVWTVVDSEVLRRGDPAAAIVTVGGGDRGPIFPLFTRAGAAELYAGTKERADLGLEAFPIGDAATLRRLAASYRPLQVEYEAVNPGLRPEDPAEHYVPLGELLASPG